MEPKPLTLRQILSQTPNYFFVFGYFVILITFAVNRWPAHASFDSQFIKALSLIIAFIATLLLWLSSLRKLPVLTLPLLHAVFAIGSCALLENLVYKRSVWEPSSLLFYGVLTATGFAGLVTYFIFRQFRSVPIARQRSLLIVLFLVVMAIIIVPFAIKSYQLALTGTSLAVPLQNLLSKPKNNTAKISNFKLYEEVNAARKDKNLKPLDYSETLETGGSLYLDQTAGTEVSRSSKASIALLSKILNQTLGYNYSSIADILSVVNSSTTEKDIIDQWLASKDIKEALLDPSFTSIGITTKATKTDVIIYALLALPSTPTKSQTQAQPPSAKTPEFTGVELFAAVNAARKSHGVGELNQKNELCTVASIRLNQQLELGKLDNHAGFNAVLEKYKDQLPYNRIAENLAEGYNSAAETVTAWEGSPGHAVLLKDGSFVWGCTAANHGFAVLIAAF